MESWCCDMHLLRLRPSCWFTRAVQFKDEPAALKLKHDAAGIVGFANSGLHRSCPAHAAAPRCCYPGNTSA